MKLFFSKFGEEEVLIPSTRIKISAKSARDNLDDYSNKCMFDVFLSICKSDYVGDTTKGYENRLVHDIYK